MHLEVVSDLTTEAFLGSLRRFFARRGKSHSIYSDNATNFNVANRKLTELYALFASQQYKEKSQHFVNIKRINWEFIPPRAPHFCGLWEATIKSFKHHLLCIVGNTRITYEQLETLIIEIEAIPNSRPISPMSSDPNDFWKRWHAEHLHQLTYRTKWKIAANQQIQIGTLVIIKEDNASPLHWTLGRIIQTHLVKMESSES